MNRQELAKIIDHTILSFNVDYLHVKAYCLEAIVNQFATVNVFSCNVGRVSKWLETSDVGITTAIAYPYGGCSIELKKYEARESIMSGATHCDFVVNLGLIKDKRYDLLQREMEEMKRACKNTVVKATIEPYLLSEEEIVEACKTAARAGIDYVKTSTGFFAPCSVDHVRLVADALAGSSTQTNAFSGNQEVSIVAAMIEGGAQRIGMFNSVQIIDQWGP